MTIKIKRDECIGCGLCASICDEVFEMDDEFKAIVKKQKDTPCLKEAIESCPVTCIDN